MADFKAQRLVGADLRTAEYPVRTANVRFTPESGHEMAIRDL
jgi:hypothetical protein